MKGRVYRHGKSWYYRFDIEPDPLTGQTSTGERERVSDRARGLEGMPGRPYSYDAVRCYRKHAVNDSLIGEPIRSKKLGRRAAEDATEAAQRKYRPAWNPRQS